MHSANLPPAFVFHIEIPKFWLRVGSSILCNIDPQAPNCKIDPLRERWQESLFKMKVETTKARIKQAIHRVTGSEAPTIAGSASCMDDRGLDSPANLEIAVAAA
jgi:hypothetical protein